MDVKPRYKQTEVGEIPEDWEAKTLGSYVEISSGESPSLFHFDDIGTPYFKVDQLNNSNKYLVDTPYRFQGDKKVPRRSLIFPKRGASILLNKIRILEEDSFMDTNLMALTIDPSLDNEYLYYALLHIELWRIADTTSIPQINNKHIKPLYIPVPGLKEQKAIAEALSDADACIDSLELLIVKKRLIKQGAMQELLTGKRRLPGFSGEWVLKQLGDVAHIKTGGRNNEDKVEDGLYPFFVRSEIIERINSYTHDCEAILVPGEGRIGSIFHYIHGRFDVHQRVYAITQFNPNISGRFIYFYLTKNFGVWAMQNTVKATVDSLRLPTFTTFEMLLPPTLDEQSAIVEVLGEMDAEIVTLKRKLEKARRLKQGMMQELLTGRIRLI